MGRNRNGNLGADGKSPYRSDPEQLLERREQFGVRRRGRDNFPEPQTAYRAPGVPQVAGRPRKKLKEILSSKQLFVIADEREVELIREKLAKADKVGTRKDKRVSVKKKSPSNRQRRKKLESKGRGVIRETKSY